MVGNGFLSARWGVFELSVSGGWTRIMNEAVLVVAVLTLPYNKSVLELCTIIALSQGSVPFPH